MITGRIVERFRERAPEWYCAANMAQFGATLLHPSETFVAPGFEAFRPFGEVLIGWVIGLLGVAWLVGLIINGARQRITSTIRMFCGFVGAMVYGMLALGFTHSFFANGILPTAIGNNFLISILALYSLYWIAIDKRRNG